MNVRLSLRPLAATLAAASLIAAFSVQSVFADQRDFTLVNNTSIPLKSVYVSAADTNSWEEDVLGRDILAAGDSVNISFPKAEAGVCVYDIKVLGPVGESGFLYGVNLCSTSTVTFSDGAAAPSQL
jgi:hypothetical protein